MKANKKGGKKNNRGIKLILYYQWYYRIEGRYTEQQKWLIQPPKLRSNMSIHHGDHKKCTYRKILRFPL